MNKTRRSNAPKEHKRTMRANKASASRHSKEEKLAKKVIPMFLEILDTIKTFHWRTNSYATHKATDSLHADFSAKTDEFVEVLLGKIGKDRFEALKIPSVHVRVLNSNEECKKAVDEYIKRLAELSKSKDIDASRDMDLLNLRDEMVGMLNRFLYLLTLH
jgi:DNA-binding ferritin-like protein